MLQSPTNELAGSAADFAAAAEAATAQQHQQRTESWQQLKSAVDESNIEITRLHLRNKDLERRYNEIIRTYRTHLLSAMQGRLDPEVRDHLIRILQLRPQPLMTTSRLSRSLDFSSLPHNFLRPSTELDLTLDQNDSA
jgi:hypothetical protein